MLEREDIEKAYARTSGSEHFEIDLEDVNNTLLDEIDQILAGRYGNKFQKMFFSVLMVRSLTSSPYNYEVAREIETLLRAKDPAIDEFVWQLIRDYGLIQGLATGNNALVRESLEAGANPSTQRLYQGARITPLIQATFAGNENAVWLLLDAGADANLSQSASESALAVAAANGALEISKMLLEAGADPNKVTIGGTALAVAANVDMMRLLLEYGADVNIPDSDGDLPIIGCIDVGDYKGVAFLKEAGTDLDHTNCRGMSAIDHARWRGNPQMIEILTA